MIAGTYFISAVGLVVAGVLFKNDSVSVGVFVAILCGTFFFASAAASAGYLTISETFPIEIRAMAIAFFFAISTGIGGAVGPGLFGKMIESGDRGQLFIGYLVAAGLMGIAAVVEVFLESTPSRRRSRTWPSRSLPRRPPMPRRSVWAPSMVSSGAWRTPSSIGRSRRS